MYPGNVGIKPHTFNFFEDSVYVFDVVQTVAQQNGSMIMANQTLKDFDYNNTFISETIYDETLKTDFLGLSVSHFFCVLAILLKTLIYPRTGTLTQAVVVKLVIEVVFLAGPQ